MQTGLYIAERVMPRITEMYAKQHGIDFQAFSDEWVLRLARGDMIKWIVGYKFDLNQSAAGELAQDKVATYSALHAADINAVPHYLVRSMPHELIHVNELHEILNGASVVAKPLEGTSGRDVMRFDSIDAALEMIRESGEPAWAVSPYYELQTEYRFIMLDGKALLAYEKTSPTYRGELKLFNLVSGAVAVDITDDNLMQELLPIAEHTMRATALRLATVDIVRLPDDTLKVLEVNDGITMEHYVRQSPGNKGRAVEVYEAVLDAMFR